ncbi:MAG TPA: hypothetical protein DDZ81_24085 [Acetobacteraceae bacterium]|jgi:Flp pilus assembly protein TadG|nr:hypothetical protein [Acetobacteraceae bacterium]
MPPNLFRDRNGVAALEFALVVPMLLTIFAGLSDFLFAFSDQIQLASGVASGAAYAFNQAQNVSGTASPVSSSDVQAKVLSSLSLPNVSVTVTGPSLNCITKSNSTPPIASLTSGTAGTTCSSGQSPANYLVITASYIYTPIMPFYSTLAKTTLTENAVVRLY